MRRSVSKYLRLSAAVVSRAYIGFVLGLLMWAVFPLFISWQSTVVLSGSMEPLIMTGDVISAEKFSQDRLHEIKVGQVLLAESPDKPGVLVTHRVKEVLRDGGGFITKGDANKKRDVTPVPLQNVIGVERLRVPYIGIPVQTLRDGNPVPSALFVLGTAAALLLISDDNKRLKKQRQDDEPDEDGSASDEKARTKRSATKAAVTSGVLMVALSTSMVAGSTASFFGHTETPVSVIRTAAVFP